MSTINYVEYLKKFNYSELTTLSSDYEKLKFYIGSSYNPEQIHETIEPEMRFAFDPMCIKNPIKFPPKNSYSDPKVFSFYIPLKTTFYNPVKNELEIKSSNLDSESSVLRDIVEYHMHKISKLDSYTQYLDFINRIYNSSIYIEKILYLSKLNESTFDYLYEQEKLVLTAFKEIVSIFEMLDCNIEENIVQYYNNSNSFYDYITELNDNNYKTKIFTILYLMSMKLEKIIDLVNLINSNIKVLLNYDKIFTPILCICICSYLALKSYALASCLEDFNDLYTNFYVKLHELFLNKKIDSNFMAKVKVTYDNVIKNKTDYSRYISLILNRELYDLARVNKEGATLYE